MVVVRGNFSFFPKFSSIFVFAKSFCQSSVFLRKFLKKRIPILIILLPCKKAIRLISNKNYNAHTEPLFKSLEILPLSHLTSFLSISFNNVWLQNAERHREDFVLALRNSENLHVPFARLHSSSIQPYIKLPRMWAQFENEHIKILRNKLEFNGELKKYFLGKLSSRITCNRLLCPSCHL
jgi:hypothetical protein